MGLDCSHDAWNGSYSAFNRLRKFVCASTGGSFPPHGPGSDLADDWMRVGPTDDDNEYSEETWPGLWEFLTHSDCDGEISPEMCVKVADDLERLLPKMEAIGGDGGGHISVRGGFVAVVRRFIDGCRRAAEANEPLTFG